MDKKEILKKALQDFTDKTGIQAKADYQKNNGGLWLWFGTEDNNGAGLYINTDGYKNASCMLSAMIDGFNIAKYKKICM